MFPDFMIFFPLNNMTMRIALENVPIVVSSERTRRQAESGEPKEEAMDSNFAVVKIVELVRR